MHPENDIPRRRKPKSNRLQDAQEAFQTRNIELTQKSHTPQAIQQAIEGHKLESGKCILHVEIFPILIKFLRYKGYNLRRIRWNYNYFCDSIWCGRSFFIFFYSIDTWRCKFDS
jgi:hypothetical protein